MFIFCLKTSHAMGMGHFFRMMNLHRAMQEEHAAKVIFVLLGEHFPAQQWLEREGIEYLVADESDAGWESRLIERYRPQVWVNDRLATDAAHVMRLKEAGLAVATFDDIGTGASLVDLHVSALAQARGERPAGKQVLQGLDYLILPAELAGYRRLREHDGKLVVSLGGSDTYGMTVKAAAWLSANDWPATLVVGPGFMHEEALQAVMTDKFQIERSPASLAEVFSRHELAITGGGITAFEAAAAGLSTLTIANELHEIGHCEYLQTLGCSTYLGYREEADLSPLEQPLDIASMSEQGMNGVSLDGAANICRALVHLTELHIEENP